MHREHNSEKLIRLRKFNSKDSNYSRVYASIDGAEERKLLAVIFVAKDFEVWIESKGHSEKPDIQSIVYQIWDCVIFWMNRFFHIHEEVSFRHLSSIKLSVTLENEEEWISEKRLQLSNFDRRISYDLNERDQSLGIALGDNFRKMLEEPANSAERALITSLIEGITNLLDGGFGNVRESIDRCFSDPQMRMIHSFSTEIPESFFSHSYFKTPRYIRKDFVGNIDLKISQLVPAQQRGKTIFSNKEINKIAKEIVKDLFLELEQYLTQFSHKSLVYFVLSELDSLFRERLRWDKTTASKILIDGESESRKQIAETIHELDACTLSCRIIIETSQYKSPPVGLQYLECHHYHACSIVERIIQYASVSDCAHAELIRKGLHIDPCGIPDLRLDWMLDIVSPYRVKTVNLEITKNQKNYLSDFDVDKEADPDGGNSNTSDFNNALVDYYGISLEGILDFVEFSVYAARRNKNTFAPFTTEELEKTISRVCRCSIEASKKFISKMILPLRSDYNDFPSCAKVDKNEILPWRFRRAYSLLRRPILQINSDTVEYVLSATFLNKFVFYCLSGLEKGYFPETQFDSETMVEYIKKAEKQRGGGDLEIATKSKFMDLGFLAKRNIKMSVLLGDKTTQLGEIDVIAYSLQPPKIYIVECKDLLPAGNMHDIIQQLDKFKGSDDKDDKLTKHLNRFRWCMDNKEKLSNFLSREINDPKLHSLVVTSRSVPMEVSSLDQVFNTRFIPIDQLSSEIS